jgi:rod shape-determining protein MreD
MQPTHSSRRILRPAKNRFIWLSFGIALALDLLPWGHLPGVPDWVALVLVFWCIHQPLRVGVGAGFLLGLLLDVADASVMGQHALAYVCLAYAATSLSRRVLWFPLMQQGLHVLPLLFGMQCLVFLIGWLVGGAFPGWSWFLASLTGALLWHPVTQLLLLPQLRPEEKDVHRPI